jgi:ornithine cyclodeaminase/alanine dehydrogenase-like protein (mu-crystallin family)
VTLFINNAEVAELLTMPATIDALETSYRALVTKHAVCRPRVDLRIPTSDPTKFYQWGTMEGGSTAGYFAVRMKSDVIYEHVYSGSTTQEKYCMRPGLYCGLIFLTSIETGEPLAFINDGVLQHMRVGGDGGIGVKYMANEDAEVVGMLGSGGMARTHMDAFMHVRKIKKLQVFSPTKENRDKFAAEMRARHHIEVEVCNNPEEAYRGAHILAALTDSTIPVTDGALLERGTHLVIIGGLGNPDTESLNRIDAYLRFGDTPPPIGRPELHLDDEYLAWEARPDGPKTNEERMRKKRARGVLLPEKRVTLAEIMSGEKPGRSSSDQITYSERGNLQGAQFFPVAGHVYEQAKQKNMGRAIPTEWFLQDIRD